LIWGPSMARRAVCVCERATKALGDVHGDSLRGKGGVCFVSEYIVSSRYVLITVTGLSSRSVLT
jgi:hypothetical protein